MPREVRIEIVGDGRDWSRAARTAGNDADRLDGSFRRVGDGASRMGQAVALGAATAGVAIGAFAASAIRSASNLGETVSLVNTVFGQAAPAMQAWSRTAAQSFGQSRNQALRAAGAFGNMFVQLGIGQNTAGDMSRAMTELSADFASFHNADSEEIITAMTAAFRGEYDALQRFVPVINAALVQQRALEMTGKDNAQALTMQEKALATYQLVMEGAGDAMGDFDRTSDSLANRQRILSATFEDLKAQIGEQLLPVAVAFAEWLSNILPGAIATGKEIIGDLAGAWEDLTTAIFGEEDWASFWADVQAGWVDAKAKWDDFTSDLRLGWETFTTALFGDESWESFWADVSAGLDRVVGDFQEFWGRIQGGFNTLVEWGHDHAPWFFGHGPGKAPMSIPQSSAPMQGPPMLPPSNFSFTGPPAFPVRPDLSPISGPFADGGVMPGPRGVHSLALVAGGETILPTHKSGMGGGDFNFYVNGDMTRETAEEAMARWNWKLNTRGDGL